MSSSQSTWTVYRRLLGYILPHWRLFLIAIIGLILVAATETGFAALMKPMLDGSFVERDEEIIHWTPYVLIGLFLVRGIAGYLAEYYMAWVARTVIKTLRTEMFSQMLRLPVTFYDTSPAGTIISKLIYDVEQVALAATDIITVMIRDTLTIIGLLGWMFYIDWQLALILMLGTPFVAATINAINRRFRRYSHRIQESMGSVSHIAEEVIEGQREVKSFGGQPYERYRFEQANEDNRRLNMKLLATSAASVPVVQLISATSAALVIAFALRQPDLSVGSFISFISAMMLMLAPMKRLTRITANLQRGVAGARSIFNFIDAPPEPDQGQQQLSGCQGAIRYRKVSFNYPNQPQRQVLKEIELDIQPGERVALVGRSGGGKTTLVNLLPRFYLCSEGEITIDGVPINALSLSSLRQHIALVSQNITLFNDTIAHNIAYGQLEQVSQQQLRLATEQAHALEFIEQLPEGFHTIVGENGVMLSGGQRQRLAIARALLKDAPILILDEATSALDTESERHIQAALERLMEGRTTLVIAHRLSTIENADRIIVLDRGVIAEQGSHQQLLQLDGLYAALHRMQFNAAAA
ncbi:lipid A export permease/ATP-binding protein MsbA [Ectothiorhodospiraceae bacterium BW-2]|nr:lipid A export permease/ATP-binding protein MsbA [Ectothiorhodospiraceae bacterium BW-2]